MTVETLSISIVDEIQKSLSNMKTFIESKISNWTSFNESKKFFLDTFKDLPSGAEKQKLWKEFSDITESARSIRKLQEEEGQFAAEMIAQALDALELELKDLKPSHYRISNLDKIEAFKSVKNEISYHCVALKALSVKANQVQSLREELTKTGMRLSVKGRLFDRLARLGDQIFPVKKNHQISLHELFFEGLKIFSKWADKETEASEILFQIKLIQSFIRELSLKKADYEAVKSSLDPIWKKAVVLKEKQEMAQKEAAEKSNLLKKGFEESFETMKLLASEGKDQDALNLYESLSLKLKDKQIGRHDFKTLKNQLEHNCAPVFERLQQAKEQKAALLKQQASLVEEKKAAIKEVMNSEAALDEKRASYLEALKLELSVDEKFSFELSMFKARLLSEQDLSNLYWEIKQLQEELRNSLACSSKDFSLSMNLQDISEDVKNLLSEVLAKL